MALNNNLLVSWNFETVSGSNGSGEFDVADVSTDYSGKGRGFQSNSQDFLRKEDILTGKKQHFETLEGEDTIQLVDGDDERVSALKKPSSIKLAIENSMYQIVSDEMMNLFTTVNAYAFKFSLPDNKYQPEYDKLIELRKGFFENIDGKPDLERYIEFYKWIDSSLGALIDQLKPENSSDISGLKTTVESHILERNKFQHKLPVTIQPNRNYSAGIEIISTNTLSRSAKEQTLSDTIEDIVSTENIVGRNFNKNVEVVQTAGKIHNNRDPKTNKTVIQTRFSAVDGLSEQYRDSSGEFSVYNETNQRAITQRTVYNISQAADRRIDQGTASTTDFEDNAFIQRNVPYTASHYYQTGVVGYEQIPEGEVLDRRLNNILLKDANTGLEVIEPPIQYAVSAKHKLRMDGAFEDMDIESPYGSKIDTFTPRTLNVTGTSVYFDRVNFGKKDDSDTFYRKIDELSGGLTVKRVEILDNIYPRKDMMGRAVIRTKPDYEEASGTFSTSALTWSQNSYNNNSADIRSFWRDSYEDRKRTRGADAPNNTGSISALNSYNLSQSFSDIFVNSDDYLIYSSSYEKISCSLITENYNNYYDLFYGIEASSSFYHNNQTFNNSKFIFNNDGFGDFSSYSHGELAKFILDKTLVSTTVSDPRAKATFIFNNFRSYDLQYYYVSSFGRMVPTIRIHNDLSYQNIDSSITPFCNNYNKFRYNIIGKSHNGSIIPEFIVSDYPSIISQQFGNPYVNNYLNIYGVDTSQEFENILENNLKIDINKFINKKSNKIKINFNATKKLLPYDGFYPQEATKKLINLFSSSYFNNLTQKQEQTIIQPLFAPGILFNTIKSGIAVDYAILSSSYTFSNNTSSIFLTCSNLLTGSGVNGNPFGTFDRSLAFLTESAINKRLSFEAIIDPDTYFWGELKDKYIAYLDPTHYSDFFTYKNNSAIVLPEYRVGFDKDDVRLTKKNNKSYYYFSNNFFSEIPNFFLKNSTLTNFVSKPEDEFETFDENKIYGFTISISKNEKFSLFDNPPIFYGNFLNYSSFFGPPAIRQTDLSNSAFDFYRKNNFSFFTPPYLNDSETLELKFLPYNGTRKYTLEEILNNLTASSTYSGIKCTLDKCLNIKNKINKKNISFNAVTGLPIDTSDTDYYKWVIQTKFETPLINFYNETARPTVTQNYYSSGSVSSSAGLQNIPILIEIANTETKGIWNSTGTIPDEKESILLSLDDSSYLDGFDFNTSKEYKSLLKAVGFKNESKTIGRLASNKIVKEAIVLLPYVENIGNVEQNEFIYNAIENCYLIKISEATINKLLKVPNYKLIDRDKNRRMDKIKTILNTNLEIDRSNSIVDLMIKMVNYNIPPHLNWLFNTDIDPFVMYIAEFSHVLSKQDLADIWQGTMPQIAQIPEEQTVTLEHSLGPDQLLGNLDLGKYDLKMKTFKIKYRANGSYYDMLDDIEDNKNYKYVKSDTSIPWYTYNWPYDYFSLVELVNIQAGEVYESGSV